MRFDDSLTTVLAADTASDFGAQSTFRQLVDLLARRRAAPTVAALAQLEALRTRVPGDVRAACARTLAAMRPPPELVGFFAVDAVAVAAPALRAVTLEVDAWLALLPTMGPAARAILRHRRDLDPRVVRGLAAFGPADFVIADARPAVPADEPAAPTGFGIPELVARIAAYQREREDRPVRLQSVPRHDGFRWAADDAGRIVWIDGVARGAVLGLSLAGGPDARVDGSVSGAFRRRDLLAGRLEVSGSSDAGGSWRIVGAPLFDPATGRFLGYHGAARRPRGDEVARPLAREDSDGLRRLVHELRTPTNAIAGFAELIGSELLGPVDPAYRARAANIRTQADALTDAIEDVDLAARIDGNTLTLRADTVSLMPLLAQLADDLRDVPGGSIVLAAARADLVVRGDERAVARLAGRLLAVVAAAGSPGERIAVTLDDEDDGMASLAAARPAALIALADAELLAIDGDRADGASAGPLLGTGFALRLIRHLASELGGALRIEPARLVLRLPLARVAGNGRATAG